MIKKLKIKMTCSSFQLVRNRFSPHSDSQQHLGTLEPCGVWICYAHRPFSFQSSRMLSILCTSTEWITVQAKQLMASFVHAYISFLPGHWFATSHIPLSLIHTHTHTHTLSLSVQYTYTLSHSKGIFVFFTETKSVETNVRKIKEST